MSALIFKALLTILSGSLLAVFVTAVVRDINPVYSDRHKYACRVQGLAGYGFALSLFGLIAGSIWSLP